jgi:site-specific recombinase XerD
MTPPTVLEDYLESLRVRHYSAGTLATRRQSLRIFFAYLKTTGQDDLREVSRQTIEDFQREMLHRYGVMTARLHMANVRYFFAHLESADAILLNPCVSVPLPRVERALPKRIMKPSEVRRMLAAPDATTPTGLRDQALLELFYSSGIRREEMARLTLPDLDIANGFVRVTRGKGGKDRVVPIGQSACEALARYLRQARSAWLKAQREPAWTDALWLSAIQPHGPVKVTAIAQIIERYALRVLGRKVPPHVWRHTCASHLVSNGANIMYVQRLLGHESLTTTQIYTRVTVPELKKTFQRAHPRTRRTATPPPLTREDAAQMHSGHKLQSRR